MVKKNLKIKVLLSLALASEICYLAIAAMTDIKQQIPGYLFCYGLLFFLYSLSLAIFNFEESEHSSGEDKIPGRSKWHVPLFKKLAAENIPKKELLTLSIVFGVIFRLTLLFTTPSLSDDIYRYIWDGKVASAGINPFHHPPNAAELAPLRDDSIYPEINHKEISTIYPPVTQIAFSALYQFDPSVLAFKAAFIALDFLTIVVLLFILKNLSMNLGRILIYVWNPLMIVEVAGAGHVDILGVFLLTFSIWLALVRKFQVANLALAFSFLTKFISVLFLPFVMLLKKENKFVLGLLFIIFTTLLFLPYADAGKKLFSGLAIYTSKWQSNGSLFDVIRSSLESIIPQSWVVAIMIDPAGMSPDAETLLTRGNDLSLIISKTLIAVIFSALVSYFLLRFKRDLERQGDFWIFKLGLILFGTFFLLSPTLHPWYLCWMVPFLVIVPNRAWLLLTGLVGLSYWTLIIYAKTEVWQESNLIKWLEYLPFYALLIFDWLRTKLKTQSFARP